MKTVLLTGKAKALAMAFSKKCNEYMAERKRLDDQITALQQASQAEMLATVLAIKAELQVAETDGIQIDGQYLDDHGHVYALIFPKEEGDNSLIDNMMKPPTTALN